MHSLKKVMLLTIIFILVAAIVLPATVSLLENFNISSQNIFNFLSAVTDSMIVKASDTDYEYSGNLIILYGKDEQSGVMTKDGVYIHSRGGDKVLEYSLNGSEFIEFEKDNNGWKPDSSGYTNQFELTKKVNTVIVREKESKAIFLRGLIVNYNGFLIAIQNARAGHSKGDIVYLLNKDNEGDLEYSIDGENNFYDVKNLYWNNKVQGGELYKDRIVIRNKETKEIVYETPKIGEIEEKYVYENGKTRVRFNVNGDTKDETHYTYSINGEKNNGNSITVETDSDIKLEAYTNKEFTTQNASKDIQVKVVNVKSPSIEVDEANDVYIKEGIIENDRLENIYYCIDDVEYRVYTKKIKLEEGTHTIKAYQITSENKVKSDIETVNVTIEGKKPEDNNQTNKDEENNKEENEQMNKDENTNNANNKNDGTDNEQKNVLKSENKNIPKTGDAISIYAVAIFVIITLNLVVRKKRKK